MAMTFLSQHRMSLVIIVGIIVRLLFAVYTPAWQSPDEYPHYWYAAQIAQNGFLPDSSPEFPKYEAYQPPLYYLLLTCPISLCPSALPFSAAPSSLPDYGLILARLSSVICAAGALLLTARILRNLKWLTDNERLAALAVTTFLPTYVGVTSSVNNDSLVILLAALSLAYQLRESISIRHLQLAGFWAGIALLAKMNAVLLIPCLIVTAAKLILERKMAWQQAVVALLPFCFGAGLLLARNIWQFGDLLALNPGVEKAPGIEIGQLFDALKTLAGSFLFAFGRVYDIILPPAAYVMLCAPILVLAALGWGRHWQVLRSEFTRLIVPVAVGIILSLSYTILYPVGGTTSWGKNLYPILPLIAVVMAVGCLRAFPRGASFVATALTLLLLLLSVYGLVITTSLV